MNEVLAIKHRANMKYINEVEDVSVMNLEITINQSINHVINIKSLHLLEVDNLEVARNI